MMSHLGRTSSRANESLIGRTERGSDLLARPGLCQSRKDALAEREARAGRAQINDAQHQWGGVSRVAGDPHNVGTVYLGTNSGRGIIYGTSTH